MDKPYISSKIDDRSFVAFLKREIHNLVAEAGFSVHRAGEIDIIVSELSSNLIKFAKGGEILYRVTGTRNHDLKFEMYCIDAGSGIANIAKIMRDGYSSANTLGHGLGSINRLSDKFEIYSQRDWGTIQYVEALAQRPDEDAPKPAPKKFDYDALMACAPNETFCGDGWSVKESALGNQIFIGDGLGHGPNAHEAVQRAIEAFTRCRAKDPVEILREIHNETRKTRGLVATVAVADLKSGNWNICGVGNISLRVFNGLESKTYTAYNGIVGLNVPRTMTSTSVRYEKHQTIIAHSDGLNTRWNIQNFPSLLKQSPAIIAATLYKDHIRGNDDVTVFAAKT